MMKKLQEIIRRRMRISRESAMRIIQSLKEIEIIENKFERTF